MTTRPKGSARSLPITVARILLLPFSIAIFGGLAAFIFLDTALICIDHLMPNADQTSGAAVS
jgi:hypothetical protein